MDNEQLVARIQGGDDEAENMLALWKQNQGFIAKIAIKYSGYAELDDLKQEGYIALCEAVRHYRPAEGVPFIHYAAFWIRQGMCRYIDNCCRTVRLPSHTVDEVRRYQKVAGEYLKYYGHEPSDWELCGFLYVSREKLGQIRKAAQMGNIRSLDEPVQGMDGGISIGDTVPSGEDMEEDVIREIDKERMKRELWLAVDRLSGNLPAAVRLRYENGFTLEKTGRVLGVTREKVRQLERKAFRILRLPHRCQKFRVYFEEYLSASPIHHVGVQRFRETWTSEVEREVLRD